MKNVVIYHAQCADGFGAAFAAWLAMGETAEYIPLRYDQRDAWLDSFDATSKDIYILDFSFERNEKLDKLLATAEHVVWRDHHLTAFQAYDKDPAEVWVKKHDHQDILLDNNKSGAVLSWEYFHPEAVAPSMFKFIDDYDRWQFKYTGTKAFNKALWSGAPWNFQQWKILLEETEYDTDATKNTNQFIKRGEAILQAHNQNVQAVVKGAGMPCEITDPSPDHHEAPWWRGLMANCPTHLTSDVGHELANQSGTFGLLWALTKDGKCSCSLRSNGDYDVSAIAKKFGGGGHKNAAGFEVPIKTLLGWMKP